MTERNRRVKLSGRDEQVVKLLLRCITRSHVRERAERALRRDLIELIRALRLDIPVADRVMGVADDER